MLRFMLDRLHGLPVDALVVATSTLERDDAVSTLASSAQVPTVRGSEGDVLARFATVLDLYPAETLIRLTGDCPLVDVDVVAATLALHEDRCSEYTSNVLPRTFPRGLDVEVVSATALREAAEEADDPVEREHVTPFIYRRPERFRLANLRSGEALGDESWTVDTAEDLVLVRDIVARLPDSVSAGWRDVLTVAGRRSLPAPGELHLRPAEAIDGPDLLRWRNDADAVRLSRSGRAVEADEHVAWLSRVLVDPASRIWIGEVDGRAIGSVRIDVESGIGTVSIVVDPAERGRGHGTRLLRLLRAQLLLDRQVCGLRALVRDENAASLATFASTGFEASGETVGDFRVLRCLQP